MGADGGGATILEELLKKALDEIAMLKADNARLIQENTLLREALAIQKKELKQLVETALIGHRKTAERAEKERETENRSAERA
jgi:hypothetical protein